jgi:hypothetical protein
MIDVGRVTADFTTLMRQAPMTAHDWMARAITDIDELFGKGYAKAHPELVGHYLMTCAIDFGSGVLAKCVTDALDGIAHKLNGLTDDVHRTDHR